MARYYYVACVDEIQPVNIANLGEVVPTGKISQRAPDFPVFVVPFEEEQRIEIFNRLFANWSLEMQMPVLVQVSDDGNMRAWLDDSE